MLNDSIYRCRVCGYSDGWLPWGDDGLTASFDICSCCGVEFGYEDYSRETLLKYRQKWIESGCQWFDKKLKPDNWCFEEQKQYIPEEYR